MVWLTFGVLLPTIGFLPRSQPARFPAAAVVVLTVGNVFVIDPANLTGIGCALSHIGLGLPLVAIDHLYQRYFLPFVRRRPRRERLVARFRPWVSLRATRATGLLRRFAPRNDDATLTLLVGWVSAEGA